MLMHLKFTIGFERFRFYLQSDGSETYPDWKTDFNDMTIILDGGIYKKIVFGIKSLASISSMFKDKDHPSFFLLLFSSILKAWYELMIL